MRVKAVLSFIFLQKFISFGEVMYVCHGPLKTSFGGCTTAGTAHLVATGSAHFVQQLVSTENKAEIFSNMGQEDAL